MNDIYTAEEQKQEHIKSLGEKLGKLYHHLWQEVAWVYSKWNEYVELFGTKQSRIELINEASPKFFRIVQDSLWEDTILHISRLTDPPKSLGTKPNLTIRKLPELVEDEVLKARLEELIGEVMEKTEFCRDWRNRKLAHRDLNLVLKEGVKPLEPASRAKIKEALHSISSVLNAISSHYFDSTTGFDMGAGSVNGAISLLYVIDDGLKAGKERDERVQSGNYSMDDIQGRDL